MNSTETSSGVSKRPVNYEDVVIEIREREDDSSHFIYPFLFILLALVGLLAGHVLVSWAWEWISHEYSWARLPLGTIGGVGFVYAAHLAYRWRFYVHQGVGTLVLVSTAVLLLLAGHLAAFAAAALIPFSVRVVAIGIVVILVCLGAIHWLRPVLTQVRSLDATPVAQVRSKGSEPPARHLILPVSAPSWRPDWRGVGDLEEAVFHYKDGVDIGIDATGIGKGIDDLGKLQIPRRANWQQLLRAVEPHLGYIESIWVIGSNGNADHMTVAELNERAPKGKCVQEPEKLGSSAFLDDAIRLLRLYASTKKVEIIRCSTTKELKFDDVPGLHQIIREVARRIRRRYRASPREILIDTTAGMKTVSIVGAISTLNHEGRFQYVKTVDPIDVILFDQRLELPPEVH